MKFGIYIPNFGAFGEAAAVADLAAKAEAAGWDGLYIWDHIAGQDLPMVDPWVALTAAAMRTSRIRLGTTVTPVPRRRPWKLARETVALDRLSGGRLTLGVGIGLGEAEWAWLGEETDARVRGDMLDEGLEVLTEFWSGESFSHEGPYYTIEQARFLPTPVQSPHIPIWVGGFWPNKPPFRRMARWDGMYPLFGQAESLEDELRQLQEAVAFVMDRRPAPGERDRPFDVVVTGVTPGDKASQAADIVTAYAGAGATWWLEGIAPYRMDRGFEMPWPVAALYERVAQGPPSIS